jgi:hypothetical protein
MHQKCSCTWLDDLGARVTARPERDEPRRCMVIGRRVFFAVPLTQRRPDGRQLSRDTPMTLEIMNASAGTPSA